LVSRDKFARTLENYVATSLKNNVGFEAFEGFDTEEGATVNFKVNRKGILFVTKAETYEADVSGLKGKLKDAENELKEAKKTISKYEAEIESLKVQEIEATVVPEETEEMTVLATDNVDAPKVVRKRRRQ